MASAEGLRRLGHDVQGLGPYAAGGSVMLARVTATGVLEAAAEPWDGGQALAL